MLAIFQIQVLYTTEFQNHGRPNTSVLACAANVRENLSFRKAESESTEASVVASVASAGCSLVPSVVVLDA